MTQAEPTNAASSASSAIAALREAGWTCVPSDTGWPEDLTGWQLSFTELASADDRVWFLSAADYRSAAEASEPAETGDDSDGFAWNEFELLSLDAAQTDAEAAEVKRFWAAHRPIMLSVRDGYAYVAVRSDGAVVFGEEPEFEETQTVAENFPELLALIAGWGALDTGPRDGGGAGPGAGAGASVSLASNAAGEGPRVERARRAVRELLFGA